MNKILIIGKLHKTGIEILKNHEKIKINILEKISKESLLKIINNYQILIINGSININSKIIKKAKKLKLIARAGSGTDNINIKKAKSKNIKIINASESNTIPAAEHTFGLILSAIRKIPQANQSLKTGNWERNKFQGQELNKKTLGIIGVGRIGSKVSTIAKAFGMKILGCDPYLKKHKKLNLNIAFTSLNNLCKKSDIITIHTPLNKETENMINKNHFKIMKKETLIINCARGKICNEEDMLKAVKNKSIKGLALDTFKEEPTKNQELLKEDNIIATPHIGANTSEAKIRLSKEICSKVINFLKNQNHKKNRH